MKIIRSDCIILSGLPGAGKTTASIYLKSQGFKIVRMGDAVDDVLRIRNLSQSESNEKIAREELRRKRGSDVFARIAIEQINSLLKKNCRIVVEGLRSPKEYTFFRGHLKNFFLIFIDANSKIRHRRLQQRPIRKMKERAVHSRETYEIKVLRINKLKRMADAVVRNEDDLNKFYLCLTDIIKKYNYDSF